MMTTVCVMYIGLTILLLSFATALNPMPTIVYAQLELNADTICVLNPDQCDEARQQEFADAIQRGIQEQLEEDYEERTGEELPTTDQFMGGVEQEGDFDDTRLAEEAAENGIPDMENMPEADILDRPGELGIETQLIDATFTKALNSVEEPQTETVEEAVDVDIEGEEEEPIERLIIRYEFDEDSDADNIALYTLPDQTVQNLFNVISTNLDSTSIELFENGRMIITYEGDDTFGEEDDTTIYAPHNFTVANGYTYDNGTIYKPDGTEIFDNAQALTSPSRTSTAVAANITPRTFQSTDDDSFRVQVPEGWVINDVDNIGPTLAEESTQGYGILAQLCPEEQQGAALPNAGISTTNSCIGAQGDVIHIIRYPDLDSRLGFTSEAITTNENMPTVDNILSYHMQKLEQVGYNRIEIVNNTDTTLNIINPQTNQTTATVPAKLIEMRYSTSLSPDETRTGYFILTATDATLPSIGATKGYSVLYEGNPTTASAAEITTPGTSSPIPPAVRQVLDSFELVAPATSIEATTPPTPTVPTPSPPPGQQEQQPPSPPQQTPELVL